VNFQLGEEQQIQNTEALIVAKNDGGTP